MCPRAFDLESFSKESKRKIVHNNIASLLFKQEKHRGSWGDACIIWILSALYSGAKNSQGRKEKDLEWDVQKRRQAAQRIRKSIWVGGLSPTRDPASGDL